MNDTIPRFLDRRLKNGRDFKRLGLAGAEGK